MGRKRSNEFSDLPKGLYFNKRSRCFYLRTKSGDQRMGITRGEAERNYYAHQSINYHCGEMSDLINRYMIEISPTMVQSTHESNLKAIKNLKKAFSGILPELVQHSHVKHSSKLG